MGAFQGKCECGQWSYLGTDSDEMFRQLAEHQATHESEWDDLVADEDALPESTPPDVETVEDTGYVVAG